VLFDITIAGGASTGTTTPLNLGESDGNTTTQFDGSTSAVNPTPTNGPTDPVDGTLSIVPPNAKISVPANTTASAGSTFTVAVSMTANTPFTYNSDGVTLAFDPTKLQVISVVSGATANGGYGSVNQSTGSTINNSAGTLNIGQFWSQTTPPPPAVSAGQVVDLADVTFMVLGNASSGTTELYVTQNNGSTTTQINGGAIVMNPPPMNPPTIVGGVDGTVTITVQPNQPPQVHVPTMALPQVLFNPAAVIGLQTANAKTEAFTGSSAITITDSDAGTGSETATLTLTGSGPGSGGAAPVGTLTATASGAANVSGNGTAGSPFVINGNLTDLNATLASLVYTPGPGFYGTATLTVTANDNGNTGFGGSLTQTKTIGIPVVGLFFSEIMLKGATAAAQPNQYLEVFSTVGSYTIPSNVYVVGVNGDKNSTGAAPGIVQDIFNVGGFTTGGNGYLAFLEETQLYGSNGSFVPHGAELVNSSISGTGFGNGGSTSVFNGVSNVHIATSMATRPGRPTESSSDLEQGSVSYLLIEAPAAPTIGTNIDAGGTGTPNGTTYASWNVLDGVGILRAANGFGAPDRTYAPITFKSTSNMTGTTIPGSTVVSTGTWTAGYVGRIAKNTGSSNADWLASQPTGSNGSFVLGTNSTQFAGQALNNVGGPNYWAPNETVVVNDGSSNQHSQVSELTLTYNEPVTIANLTTDFSVLDAQGNPLSINVLDNHGLSSGSDSNVTKVVITFNLNTGAAAGDTYAYGTSLTDNFGNAIALTDGNFFLNTVVAAITNNGVALDGSHNGVGGSTTVGSGNLNGNGVNQIDEFWRLFGDAQGHRRVNGSDNSVFTQTVGSTGGGSANGERRLGVDHPVLHRQRLQEFRQGLGRRQRCQTPWENQLPGAERLEHAVQVALAKSLRQLADREQIGGRRLQPPAAVEGQGTAGNDAV